MGTHIVFSGIDGCGKSTQSMLLAEALLAKGYNTSVVEVITKEEKKIINQLTARFDDLATTLLYEGLHRQKFVLTQQKLKDFSFVISDRWSEAFDAHHICYGPLKNIPLLRNILKEVSFENKLPDIGILIDIEPKIAIERMHIRGMDHFDKQDISYFQSIRDKLLNYAKKHSWLILEGSLPEKKLHKIILNVVLKDKASLR